ncbi:MAG: Rne/Rng family ribonuclease [Mangrovibacterium sp.]
MSKEIVIDVAQSEVMIALLEEKRLVELSRDKSDAKFSVGDIYLGKVKKIMPSLNAAFVNVGYSKDAFLHYQDLGPQFSTLNEFRSVSASKKTRINSIDKIRPHSDIFKDGKITDVLNVGQDILVQVAKEPINSKGPRLTSELSIAGRNMVLLPFSEKINISTKIKSAEERKRLKHLIESIKPKGYGVIVRTACEGKRVAELDKELRRLVQKFESLFKTMPKAQAPQMVISELSRAAAMIRDIYTPEFSSIVVNDEETASNISDYIRRIDPEKTKVVKHYTGGQPIFDYYGVDKQIKSAFGKTVTFKNGAYLVIEHTEAFHVIDVNSGNRSKAGVDQETNALEVNLAAVDEVARQLRLRDMGGIIVIDFIDMHTAENKKKVLDRMRDMMKEDRTKHNILPLSKFCLMQITRQRVRMEQHVETAEVCPTCKGAGKVTPTVLLVDEIAGKLEYIFNDLHKKKLRIEVHPFVEAYLTKGIFSTQLKWRLKFKKKTVIQSSPALGFLDCRFFDEDDNEIVF